MTSFGSRVRLPIMTRLSEAIEQIDFARQYTQERILTIPFKEWFTVPTVAVSTIGWQVGHLAMAQYRVCLERLRKRTAADEELISDDFLSAFGRNSQPTALNGYTAETIFEVFQRVHQQVLSELPIYPDSHLDLEPLRPHPLFTTRIGALRYAPMHEMIHCGQIAFLRRMLGHQPIW